MGITPQTMAAIQHAGQALDAAHAALQAASQQQAARLAGALQANAFGLENDAHFEHWKTIARMAQAVHGMEEQLRSVFQAARDIAQGASGASPLSLPLARSQAPAELVEAVADATVRRRRRPAAGVAATRVPPLKGNAARVRAYLATVLNRRAFKRVTHGDIVAGCGIPLGSVGAALAALKQRGLLLEGERGSYRLA